MTQTKREQMIVLTMRISAEIRAMIHKQSLKEGHGRVSRVVRDILTEHYLGKK